MTIAARIKEERLRLELNQPSFAALGGATKSAQIGWERGTSVPNATVLAAWSEAGIDVPYILSGRRLAERRADTLLDISEQLSGYRRRLIDPETPHSDDATRNGIQSIIWYDAKLMTPDQREEAERLLAIAQDEAKLREFRAAETVALRHRKDQMKRRLTDYFEGVGQPPSETAMYLLLQLAIDHGVPVRTLYDLWEQIQADATDRRDA